MDELALSSLIGLGAIGKLWIIVSRSLSTFQVRSISIYSGKMTNLRTEFAENGVVVLRNVLDEKGVALASQAFERSRQNPGPAAGDVLAGSPGAFYQDHANPNAFSAFPSLLTETGLAESVRDVIGTEHLWLMYEQIWHKEGAARRTPWHQDVAYVPVEGNHLAVLWLNLDCVSKENSLEFIPGSHRGPLYNPTAFEPNDPSASMFPEGIWPTLPDIEGDREHWPIKSWAVEPCDVILFHPGVLHGGAPTQGGGRRRSVSLRLFGDDARCATRPEDGLAAVDQLSFDDGTNDPITAMARVAAGTPFRHPGFCQIL